MGDRPLAEHPLNEATLLRHSRRVSVPTYDRWSLQPSVVHVSVGAFHRSHQAVYFDEIAERGLSREWGLVGVGLHRRQMGDALAAQDGLYTVVSRAEQGTSARIVGVMGRYLYAPDNAAAVLAVLADPRTRLVTMTVTGDGYAADALEDPQAPRSAIGFLVEALHRRHRAGIAPFTVLSCDNMPDNGGVARLAVLSEAQRRDPRLAEWIEARGAFPSSMVDRITPRTTLADRDLVARSFGVLDRWPVMTEPFSQWIIEDSFCHGRPPLDLVGAQFVPDVRPYSLMKTRMLNAAHCAIGFVGSLAGYRRIDDAVADPALAGFLDAMMGAEIAPLLRPVPGIDLDDYRRTLMERFANRGIADQLARLARNGSTKVPCHLVSTIREARAAGRPHARLTLAVAAWMLYLRGFDQQGRALSIEDPMAGRLCALAPEPRALLQERSLFGDLADDESFALEVEACLDAIGREGVREAARASDAPPVQPLAA